MKKTLVYTILSFLLFSFSFASASEKGHFHIAACKGLIDGVDFALDFFEEADFESGKISGSGVVVQTMGKGEVQAKFMSKIDVRENGDSEREVTMYAILEPSVMFARFSLNIKEKSTIEIYAPGFGAVWGKFTCLPAIHAL